MSTLSYRDGVSKEDYDVAFLLYDLGKLGVATYNGAGCAAATVVLSALGVVGPVPRMGQTLQAVQTVEHAVELARLIKASKDIDDDILVCRGGACTAESFIKGSGVTISVDGTLNGVSAQSRVGANLRELAKPFKNNQVGVTSAGKIRAAGGRIMADGHAGNRNHATIDGLTPQQLENLFSPAIRNPVAPALRSF
ncbi:MULTISPECIES: hypothetical protein [unclassified Undibacterium]|uniref:hypothetical protein n=1 Tax=unclassified Undibacterium TaxID=2630295 RepID=UPI002AC96A8A|nr:MULTISPECIES: hypothetical protein [unclassified Undibacterium]MEB0139651.1 hypothetical protein [Undibacterium sp. CCC2.1]MEB0172532.1 hypothetical protein [Undibacterium sp. CCC1.1]MEB0176373.1 hypothetical protein [Undibacterium sp. CCC3.4]MEB0215707.1 hypothetical protein [Undibacterium sp. 5I2]WPX42984.1 hypothetical protein RHM61_16610 [Undibacterium sp. CCC3.4]